MTMTVGPEEPTEPIATVFFSYSHNDKPLARALKAGLEAQGCRCWIDEGELKVGESLFDSIAAALDQVDFVAALISTSSVDSPWCQKEISLAMTGEVAQHGVTVLPLRVGGVPVPATLKGKLYLDVDPDNVPDAVEKVMADIRKWLAPSRPLPPRRRTPTVRATAPATPHGPLSIVEVDRNGITTPTNDGTRGSGLYAVPFRLSGTPDSLWARLFMNNWDNPPVFGMMHRKGIARIAGDRIVLDGTTVQEVAQHHRRTLELAVQATNDQHAEHLREAERANDQTERAAREHQAGVDLALAGLTFTAPPAPLRVLILRHVQAVEQDAGFRGVLGLDELSTAVGHERHLVRAELIRLLADGLIATPSAPAEDFGGGYSLIKPTLTSQGLAALSGT